MKNDPYLKKQTNKRMRKKKKKERKKENSHTLLSHARKAMVLSAVPNAFYHLAGLIQQQPLKIGKLTFQDFCVVTVFFLPTKRLGVLKGSYKCVWHAFQIEWEVGSVGF